MSDLKIAHFGNMAKSVCQAQIDANDGYVVAKALRDLGVQCDLYVDFPQHVASYPQWEVCDLGEEDIGDPYDCDWKALNHDFTKPYWIKFFYVPTSKGLKPLKLLSMLPMFPAWGIFWAFRMTLRELIWKVRWQSSAHLSKVMDEYDLNICHVPYAIWSQRSQKPYIVFDAGTIRYLRGYYHYPFQQMRMEILEQGYKKANLIFATNIDTFHLFKKLKLYNYVFMPFLIDTDRYKPLEVENPLPYEYVIFHPARQYWREKANYMMIQAFQKFHKEQPDSVLAIVDWSDDRMKTRHLIGKLGLENDVIYLGLMSKARLIQWYNKATVVADQFLLKGMGTTVSESMACGRPTIISTSRECSLEAYGEVPPILFADSSERIFNQLVKCTDKGFRKKVGDESREWVLKHHSPKVVAQKHLEYYEKIAQ